jgi:hypothetical protein
MYEPHGGANALVCDCDEDNYDDAAGSRESQQACHFRVSFLQGH